jgi:16S rRNA (guanine(1405)-N(7))-methyltransferase
MNDDLLQAMVEEILASRKYRELDLAVETVRDLLEQELPRHRSQKDALKSVRQKLHNVVAPYLGDPDYPVATRRLDEAFASLDAEAVRTVCRGLLNVHASTRERLPLLEDFYARLWEVTGEPQALLDLACGLHPFGFPWMGLPVSTRYYAYDIVLPRVDLINHYFNLQGLEPLAERRDILVAPPQVEADVALFFKEAHRFEQRQHGCNRHFWRSLKVPWLLISLPMESLTKKHSLAEGHRRLVYNNLDGLGWDVTELEFEGELVFCVRTDVIRET